MYLWRSYNNFPFFYWLNILQGTYNSFSFYILIQIIPIFYFVQGKNQRQSSMDWFSNTWKVEIFQQRWKWRVWQWEIICSFRRGGRKGEWRSCPSRGWWTLQKMWPSKPSWASAYYSPYWHAMVFQSLTLLGLIMI